MLKFYDEFYSAGHGLQWQHGKGFRVEVLGLRAKNSRLILRLIGKDLGFRVYCSGLRVKDLGCRVSGAMGSSCQKV